MASFLCSTVIKYFNFYIYLLTVCLPTIDCKCPEDRDLIFLFFIVFLEYNTVYCKLMHAYFMNKRLKKAQLV